MRQATVEQASPGLRLGRHAVGIMVAALANPMIYFSTDQVVVWLATWGPVLIATAVIYGLLALFLTRRARAAWLGGAIALAWVLLLLLVVGNWMNYQEARAGRFTIPAPNEASSPQGSAGAQAPRPSSDDEWWKKGAKPIN